MERGTQSPAVAPQAGPLAGGVTFVVDTACSALDIAKSIPLWGSAVAFLEKQVRYFGQPVVEPLLDVGRNVIAKTDQKILSLSKRLESANASTIEMLQDVKEGVWSKGLLPTAADLYLKHRSSLEKYCEETLYFLEVLPFMWVVTMVARWVLTVLFVTADWATGKYRPKVIEPPEIQQNSFEDHVDGAQNEVKEQEPVEVQNDHVHEAPAAASDSEDLGLQTDSVMEEMSVAHAPEPDGKKAKPEVDEIEELFDIWGMGGSLVKTPGKRR